MARKFALIASLAAVAAAGVAGPAAAATPAASVSISIKVKNGDFSGKVFSSKLNRCVKDRTIYLVKQKGNHQRPSTDKRIAMDTISLQGNHGEWSTGNTGLEGGKYYAYLPGKHGCKAATSRTVPSDRLPQND